MEIFPGVKQDVESLSVLGQPLNNKCPDISEFEGKQIAVEICKFAKSNLVQVNIELAYFVGAALFKYWIWLYPLHRISFTTSIMIL